MLPTHSINIFKMAYGNFLLCVICVSFVIQISLGCSSTPVDYPTMPTRSTDSQCDFTNPQSIRDDCGYSGINKQECESRGCCYDPLFPQARNCFLKQIACYNFVRNVKSLYTSSKAKVWYTIRITKDSRSGIITSQRSSLSHNVELNVQRRDKRALTSLYCPDIDYGTRIVFNATITDLQRQEGNAIGDINIVRPNNWNNPVQQVYRRQIRNNVFRVEALVALIEARHSNPNNRINFPYQFTAFMRNQLEARAGDVRFHLVASQYLGPPELYNMIPGHASVNANVRTPQDRRFNDWRSVESAIAEHLRRGDTNSVYWRVFLYYEGLLSGRPTHITYQAIFLQSGEEVRFITGSSMNEQL